jgi:hypothetical protein
MTRPKAVPRSRHGVRPARWKPVATRFTAAAAATVVLSALAGCAAEAEPNPAGSAGSAAGTSAASGGTGGFGTGGQTAGAASNGSAGAGVTAGISGGGAGNGGTTAGVSGGSSSSAGSGGSSIAPTFETVKLVLQGGGPIMPCSAAPCHGVNGMAPPDDPLELPPTDDQQLYTNLTSYTSKACGNTKLVTPGNPAQSALLTILQGPCGMTPRMPYMCTEQDGNCIPADYIAALEQWIANGAPRQ